MARGNSITIALDSDRIERSIAASLTDSALADRLDRVRRGTKFSSAEREAFLWEAARRLECNDDE